MARARHALQLLFGPLLDLPHALPRELQVVADRLERLGVLSPEAEPEFDHFVRQLRTEEQLSTWLNDLRSNYKIEIKLRSHQ